MKKKTTIWLEDIDHKAIEAIRKTYRVGTDSAAIRLALALALKEIEKQEGKRG